LSDELLVAGSIALDSLDGEFGSVREEMGGSALYFALAASLIMPVRMVAPVGQESLATVKEILGSRLELEDRLGTAVELFAYPYGAPNNLLERNRELIKDAGFRCCCSCFGGLNGRGSDPFQLRRVAVSSWFGSPHRFGFDVALRRTSAA